MGLLIVAWLAILLSGSQAQAQTKPKAKPKSEPTVLGFKVFTVNGWELGERKMCSTYDTFSYLLSCDHNAKGGFSDTFDKFIDAGLGFEEAYYRALSSEFLQGKEFDVAFVGLGEKEYRWPCVEVKKPESKHVKPQMWPWMCTKQTTGIHCE